MPKTPRENEVYYFSVTVWFKYNTADNSIREVSLAEVEAWQKCFKTYLKTTFEGSKFVFQCEVCPSTNRHHLQTFLHLKEKKRASALKNLFNGEPLWSGADVRHCSDAGKHALRTYAMKDETRFPGSCVMAEKTLYKGQDVMCVETDPTPMQKFILDRMKETPDARKITWFFNKSGKVGKTALMKYLVHKHMATSIPIGTAGQMKQCVATAEETGTYFVDLPRTRGMNENMRDIYSTIEEIKNGFIQGCMYGKFTVNMMMPPHVFIMANELPNVDLLSLDRWEVYNVQDLHSDPIHMSRREVEQAYRGERVERDFAHMDTATTFNPPPPARAAMDRRMGDTSEPLADTRQANAPVTNWGYLGMNDPFEADTVAWPEEDRDEDLEDFEAVTPLWEGNYERE